MNIWALEGHKVKVTNKTINSGYKHDSEQVKKLCEIDKIYTVEHTEVHSCSTFVCLKEFPGVLFNSVNFEDAVEQSEEDDMRHEDWWIYNR
jgi:hypothetical protein